MAFAIGASAQWQPAGDKLKTIWADKVDPNNVLPEYPRPLLERSAWMNLNGLWDYAILDKGKTEPSSFDGKILVPFAVESSLSGVQKEVKENQELWYKRTFKVPAAWKGKNVKLNFGAVDWIADVFVNDMKYSDTPITKSISEDIADIYQDIKNFVCLFQLGINETMHDAIIECNEHFRQYWGQTLTNTLRALHDIRYNTSLDDEEEEGNEL